MISRLFGFVSVQSKGLNGNEAQSGSNFKSSEYFYGYEYVTYCGNLTKKNTCMLEYE